MSETKKKTNRPDECQRCGICCRQGGPALHIEDRVLLENGVITEPQLVTVRFGEPANDPLQEKIVPAASEFIKIGGRDNTWSCVFLEETTNNCNIYRQRPLECRLLFCGDTEPLEEVIGKDLLTRKDLLAADDPVLTLIDRLEEECPYQRVSEILVSEDHAAHLKELNDLVRRDLGIRQAFLNHLPEREKEELFLFGRPIFLVLVPYGFKLLESNSGLNLEIDRPKA